jgi:hypothetical protein
VRVWVRNVTGALHARKGKDSGAACGEHSTYGRQPGVFVVGLAIKVEVDERVELLECERLRRLVENEHTLPFLRGLLVALEYYHLVTLDRNFPISVCEGEGGGEGGADERWLWVAQP